MPSRTSMIFRKLSTCTAPLLSKVSPHVTSRLLSAPTACDTQNRSRHSNCPYTYGKQIEIEIEITYDGLNPRRVRRRRQVHFGSHLTPRIPQAQLAAVAAARDGPSRRASDHHGGPSAARRPRDVRCETDFPCEYINKRNTTSVILIARTWSFK